MDRVKLAEAVGRKLELIVKRYILVLAFICSLLLPFTLPVSHAAGAIQGKSATSSPRVTAAPPIRSLDAELADKVLPNGLEVIVLADHAVPIVTIELACKNGSYTEPPELNGLSHLYE